MLSSETRTLGDLADEELGCIHVSCTTCGRTRMHSLASLLVQHGPGIGLPDLLAELSRQCPQRTSDGIEPCGATFLRTPGKNRATSLAVSVSRRAAAGNQTSQA
jgi:hypothetical protein